MVELFLANKGILLAAPQDYIDYVQGALCQGAPGWADLIAALATIDSNAGPLPTWFPGVTAYQEPAKLANEPLSPAGDYDGDGLTNKEEFDNVIAAGGGINAFVMAATWFNADGTEPLPVAGLVSLGFLAAMSTLGGFVTIRRKK